MQINIANNSVDRMPIFFHMLLPRSCASKWYQWLRIWLSRNIRFVSVNVGMSARNRHFQTNYWCITIYGWVNNRDAGDLRRYRTHCDVTVMIQSFIQEYVIHLKKICFLCLDQCLYNTLLPLINTFINTNVSLFSVDYLLIIYIFLQCTISTTTKKNNHCASAILHYCAKKVSLVKLYFTGHSPGLLWEATCEIQGTAHLVDWSKECRPSVAEGACGKCGLRANPTVPPER